MQYQVISTICGNDDCWIYERWHWRQTPNVTKVSCYVRGFSSNFALSLIMSIIKEEKRGVLLYVINIFCQVMPHADINNWQEKKAT